MQAEEIRKNLLDIRYYYFRKKAFDKATLEIGENAIVKLVKQYNAIIVNAPPRLYDLYVSLYTQNTTQENLAEELNYSSDYIQKLHQKLMQYFQENLS